MAVMIKDIPESERPCERLINNGVENLSNEELLAIILKSGLKGISVKKLSEYLLSSVGDIKLFSNITYESLKNIKGIGPMKACNILASIEFGRRVNKELDNIRNIKLNTPELIYKYYKNKLNDKYQEYFYAVYLDNNKNIICDKLLFIGTINSTVVHPREIFKEAYMRSASSIVVLHNHPSGNVLPSKEDIDLTINLKEIGSLLGIKLIDHIIVGKDKYYSMRENKDII